ncbi:MAG: guanylate kinase [Bacteroidales bacterium]|nr:guanylate kinase [Bacteroidales bacterium]MDD2424948.1 guanylate kinase [Bacteroidales bacterium]MDD3989100.1 guanylate kinase [Bacteroidales bacterium]MDD4639653.1 guanylate kinase [Bacteroidales bacterium]
MKNNKRESRVVIFSAPSGSGKSTIVKHLLGKYNNLGFSVSATSRAPRGSEQDGKEYYFLTPDLFRKYISEDKFVEYEEVYDGLFYGTLRSEVERIWNEGRVVLFDIDVKGGLNLKKLYGDNALSVFIKAPSLEILRERLVKRGTDTPEAIEKRVDKARYELSFEPGFDKVIVNDILSDCLLEAEKTTESFLSRSTTKQTLK